MMLMTHVVVLFLEKSATLVAKGDVMTVGVGKVSN